VNQASRKLQRTGEPLYRQLAQIVRKQIESGEYKPGDPLPPEEQMANQCGVSLITVREARRALVREGLIWRHSGRGTFVAQKPSLITYRIASTTADVYAFNGGLETPTRSRDIPKREYLGKRLVRANPETAELLKLPVKTKLVEVQVRTWVEDVPLSHVVSLVPVQFGRGLTPKRLEEQPLVLLLSNVCPAPIIEADQWTMTASATERMAEMLNIKAGDPVLVIQRVFYDRCGAPVQASTNTFRGDRFRQHVRLHWPTRGSIPLLAELREAAQRYDVTRPPTRFDGGLSKRKGRATQA
jgi:GntR family transcriptional regulator